jgi:DNA-binding transcriptional LysR family regulator
MYPGVELRVMRYFLAVVAEMHFTRAAERVRVAQPSLSKQIRNLEEDLGVQLLKRSRRGVKLTNPVVPLRRMQNSRSSTQSALLRWRGLREAAGAERC